MNGSRRNAVSRSVERSNRCITLSGPIPLRAEHFVSGSVADTFAALAPIARSHGTIVHIDRARGTFTIQHDPFAAMPMAMTMDVEPVHHSDLHALRVGEPIDVTIDTRTYPWPGSDISPATR